MCVCVSVYEYVCVCKIWYLNVEFFTFHFKNFHWILWLQFDETLHHPQFLRRIITEGLSILRGAPATSVPEKGYCKMVISMGGSSTLSSWDGLSQKDYQYGGLQHTHYLRRVITEGLSVWGAPAPSVAKKQIETLLIVFSPTDRWELPRSGDYWWMLSLPCFCAPLMPQGSGTDDFTSCPLLKVFNWLTTNQSLIFIN